MQLSVQAFRAKPIKLPPCEFIKFDRAPPTDTNCGCHGFLCPSDGVATTSRAISISMVAAVVLFLMEAMNAGYHRATPLNACYLVALVVWEGCLGGGVSGAARISPGAARNSQNAKLDPLKRRRYLFWGALGKGCREQPGS